MITSTSVTYPAGSIDTLEPFAAFTAPEHDEAQVEVSGPRGVHISRACNTTGNRLWCGKLPAASDLSVRVRVAKDGVWQEWSDSSKFSTPPDPIVKVVFPANAGRVHGPLVTLRWSVESEAGAPDVEVVLDGKTCDISAEEAAKGTVEVRLEGGVHELSVRAAGRAGASCRFYVWNTPVLSGSIVQLDLKAVGSWDVGKDPVLARRMYDILHCAACLQGIVNRDRPRLMLRLLDEDDFWLQYLRQPGRWLSETKIERIDASDDPEAALAELAARYGDDLKGLVVWDEDVASTSNVATSVCAVEDLLPVRSSGGSLSRLGELLTSGGLGVSKDLRGMFPLKEGSTGSAKCDSYLWASDQYLKHRKANPRVLGYWLDSFWLKNPGRMSWWECCLSNHDWLVANRGLVLDLSNWGDEAPQDDPSQPVGTDLETFKKVMLQAYEAAGGKMIHVSGFTPWGFKYTDHAEPKGRHEPVATEWEVVRVLSAYNAWLDADAHGISAMANASLWRHLPRPDRYIQNPPPTPEELKKLGYLDSDGEIAELGFTMFYIGDFDSAAWLYRQLPKLYADERRGQVPMGWAINPNLSLRNPAALDLAYTSATQLDYFTAGDSGAGYVNPTMMIGKRPVSGLPDGSEEWIEHCRDFFRRFDLRITGFLINGHAGKLTEASLKMTAAFSPDGTASQRHWYDGNGELVAGMPLAWMCHDLDPNVEASANCISGFRKQGLQFLNFRTILLGPTYVEKLREHFNRMRPEAPIVVLGPREFYYLLRKHLGGTNDRRATFTFDTAAAAGAGGRFDVGVRNDGWDVWKRGETHFVYRFGGSSGWLEEHRQALSQDVRPGEAVVLEAARPEDSAGATRFRCDMADAGGPFSSAGNPIWEASL